MFSPIIKRRPPLPVRSPATPEPDPRALHHSYSTPSYHHAVAMPLDPLPQRQPQHDPQNDVYTPSPASTLFSPHHQQLPTYSNESAVAAYDPAPIKGPSSVSKIGTYQQVPRGRRRLGGDYNGGMNFISREQAAYIT
jgi:hypothetical protein